MDNIWINGLRKIAIVFFCLFINAGFIGGIIIWRETEGLGGFFAFLLALAGSVLVGFLSIAVLMVFLDLAENVALIKERLTSSPAPSPRPSSSPSSAPASYRKDLSPISGVKVYEPGLLKQGTWQCKNCNKINTNHALFCVECGTSK